MGAFKKGQGFHGPYTDNNSGITPDSRYDDIGHEVNVPQTNVDKPSNMTKRTIAPITGAPGLAAKLPKS
jgi:hypothetical protein